MNTTSASTVKPRCVADALGLGSLADGEPGMDPGLLRQIYRHARDEDGQRKLFENDSTFAKGWVDLTSPRAQGLISTFVPLDEADGVKQARRIAQNNLEAQPWNDILGINEPPIICKVKIHGARWGLRFQSGVGTRRGAEKVNEELPGIAGTESSTPPPPCPADKPAESNVKPSSAPAVGLESRAAETLAAAGMPQ